MSEFPPLTPVQLLVCAQWYHPSCIHEGYDFARDEFDQGEDYLCQHCLHKRTSARHANTPPFQGLGLGLVLTTCRPFCVSFGGAADLAFLSLYPSKSPAIRPAFTDPAEVRTPSQGLHRSPQGSGPSFSFLVRLMCICRARSRRVVPQPTRSPPPPLSLPLPPQWPQMALSRPVP
jgi:hypothetical protein